MALFDCPECQRRISDQAAACPGCGYPVKQVPGSRGVASAVFESGRHEGSHAGTIKTGIAGLTAASLGGWLAKALAVVVIGIVALAYVVTR
jgi:predicted amidophosphoribosyltransferase